MSSLRATPQAALAMTPQAGLRIALRAVLAISLGSLLIPAALALDTSKLQPHGYVNDFAGVLNPGSAQTLEAYCASVERATGAQIAIVTVKSLEDEPIEDVTN